MSQEILLYDLPSKAPMRSWSGNAWKTRLVLNFKGIPYKTEWVPFTRLQETLKATGVEPNPPGSWSEYSIPTIRLPDGTYHMDSVAIARKLESLHPSPPLHLNTELENEAQTAMGGGVFFSLVYYLLPIGIKTLVAPEDEEWFTADRAQRFGITVEEAVREPTEEDARKAYAAAQPGLEKCRALLRDHKKDAGPFILGSVPCYADFIFISIMLMYRQAGKEYFERFLQEAGGELRELYEACEKWTMKQD